jgi:Glycosyl transferase family 2
MSPPEISVVLVTPDDARVIRRTLRHLRAQTARDRIELVLVASSRAALGLRPDDVDGFRAVQIVEAGPIDVLADARALGVRRSSTELIAFAEDHCYPAPAWAERLIAAHREAPDAAIGPMMHNENPRTTISRAAIILQFGCCAAPQTSGERESLAWHNTSYKRDALLGLEDRLGWSLTAEGVIQDGLRHNGSRLVLDAGVEVSHVNVSRLRSYLTHAFWGGRLFGAMRARVEGWGPGTRLLRALACPVVPLVRIARAARTLRERGELSRLPVLLPAMIVGLVPHAAGEAAGYLVGMGPTRRAYSHYEHRRLAHVARRDRADLARREPVGGALSESNG